MEFPILKDSFAFAILKYIGAPLFTFQTLNLRSQILRSVEMHYSQKTFNLFHVYLVPLDKMFWVDISAIEGLKG